MTKIFLLSLSLLLTTPQSFASGSRVGNGGDGVMCAGQNYFYDLYELGKLKKKTAIFPEKNRFSDAYETAHEIIIRQSTADAGFKNLLLDYLSDFALNAKFAESFSGKDDIVSPVDDNPALAVGKGCKVVQAARSDLILDKWTYTVNKKFWDHMDLENRTALVLHELLNRLSSELGHDTSTAAKLVNQEMLTNSGTNHLPCHMMWLRQANNLVLPNEYLRLEDRVYFLKDYYIDSTCTVSPK